MMQPMMKNSVQVCFLQSPRIPNWENCKFVSCSCPIVFQTGKIAFLSTSTYNESQWLLLLTSCKSDMESIKVIHECAFQNLEKAGVIITGIVLDGVPFMEEFRLNHHHHTHEQQTQRRKNLLQFTNN